MSGESDASPLQEGGDLGEAIAPPKWLVVHEEERRAEHAARHCRVVCINDPLLDGDVLHRGQRVGAVMPQRRSDIGGGIGIGSTFAAEPIFSIRRASIIRGARRIVAVEPVEDPGRRQRVLGPAAWPLQGQPEEAGAPRPLLT